MSETRIEFPNVPRLHPYVLTRHDINRLCIGRRAGVETVSALLVSFSEYRFEAKTFSRFLREVERLLDAAAKDHSAAKDCWCEPTAEHVDPDTGVTVWLHKEIQ